MFKCRHILTEGSSTITIRTYCMCRMYVAYLTAV